MKYLPLLFLMSCSIFYPTRQDKIIDCIDDFLDRDTPSKTVFKECQNIYRITGENNAHLSRQKNK